MKHLRGKRSGNKAEMALIGILKDERNKLSYVMSTLSKYSNILHSIVRNNNDLKLRKYLLKLHKDNSMQEVYQSQLNIEEVNYLRNAIKARYMTVVRKLKLPLN